MAGWQSGHAADCKSAYAGSIPTSASIAFLKAQPLSRLRLFSFRPDGETGRRKGLKIPHPQGYVGSSPTPGTKEISDLGSSIGIIETNPEVGVRKVSALSARAVARTSVALRSARQNDSGGRRNVA